MIKKGKSSSVRWKIFTYFIIFGAVMLALLWLFQVKFLDQFYRAIKTNAIKNASEEINESFITSSYKESIDAVAQKNDLCVSVLDQNHTEIYTSNRRDPRCMIDKMKGTEIDSLYQEALENGGSAARLIATDENRREWEPPIQQVEIAENRNEKKGRLLQNITYASVLKMTEDQSIIVLVNAEISPVEATIGTIRTQLVIISMILMVLALILAVLISRKVANPIIATNNSAKKLAKGEYSISFQGKGYLEIQELNDTLNYAAKELNKVQSYQRELIANMSHDLRTPLTMISGYGEMMRDIPGENTPENVQIIIDETNRLTNLVNDILDLSKLQSGVQSLTITTFNLTDLILQLIQRYQKLLSSQEYEIVFEYEEKLDIQADEIKLDQVIYNLINNAMTYCGEDKKVIVRQKRIADGVRLEIIDHGQGIAKEELPYVWERYYKTKQHHIRASVGTGLGLSIVKNILELHKARYGVNSELHKGTTFWIEIIENGAEK